MNVINFFKFIASKRPDEYGIDKAVGAMNGGFSVPADENSSIDPDTFVMNGLLTTKEPPIHNFPDIRSYKKYNNDNLEDFYYVFDMNDRLSTVYLSDIYGGNHSAIARLMKYKAGIENPSLKQKPESPNEIDDITEVTINDGEEQILAFCRNYLNDLSEKEYKWIKISLEDDYMDDEDFKDALDDDFDRVIYILNKITTSSWCPDKVSFLHDYLFDCFRSVAEYESNIKNLNFDLVCNGISEFCNIKDVTFNWPLVYIHLDVSVIFPGGLNDEPEFNYGRWDNTGAVDIAEKGLSYKYIIEYFKKYPIEK